jgi:hypothetical protein
LFEAICVLKGAKPYLPDHANLLLSKLELVKNAILRLISNEEVPVPEPIKKRKN